MQLSSGNTPAKYTWRQFGRDVNALNWYDVCTSFIFRFMAKTSEPLLAAGVIISAIDFLQRGQLLLHNPGLSLWWSIAQGVAMEVSVGPVLVNALDAKEEDDVLKARLYATLSVTLAIVGGAMLLMQFGLSVGGLTEGQIPAYILWPLFVVRTFASIGYLALSCTKQKRFSGSSPKAALAETTRAFEDMLARFTQMQESTNATLQQIEATTLQQFQSLRHEVSGQLAQAQSSFDGRLAHMEMAAEQRLQEAYAGFVQEVSVVKVTLEEQSKVIRRLPEKAIAERSESLSLRPQFQSPKGAAPTSFDKKQFVLTCLTESPDMSISEVQRRATEIGHSIAPSYISEVRKAYRTISEGQGE